MNENENVMPELTLDAKEVAAPTLTLEEEVTPGITLETAGVKNEMVVDKTENPIGVDDSMLSDAEKKQVDAFVKQIDIKDSNIVLQYGSGAQKKMAAFSEKAIENVKTKDMGEVGKLLTDVVMELKGFDEEDYRFRTYCKHRYGQCATAVDQPLDGRFQRLPHPRAHYNSL